MSSTSQISSIPTVTGNIFPTTDFVQSGTVTLPVATNTNPEKVVEVKYSNVRVVGNGSFGVVYVARLIETNEQIAIKKVLQDRRYKNRELQIMRQLEHQNVVKLKYFFYLNPDGKEDVYLNLILEYVPDTVYRVARHYTRNRQAIPTIYIRLYIYQLFRALAYIHSVGVCHRDIKPQNLLIDTETGVLKLCDFGSAKFLVCGEPNVSYICSRYYRAPELIFGATDYTNSIDIWSAGTVLAELILGHPIFPGESGVDQLVEIIKLLGTPSREQIQQMNSGYREFIFPSIRAQSWSRMFRPQTSPEAIDLVSKLLEYNPAARLTPFQACAHSFFDDLRKRETRLPNGRQLPPVLQFTAAELTIEPELNSTLVPESLSPLLPVGPDSVTTTPLKDEDCNSANSKNSSEENRAGSGAFERCGANEQTAAT